MQPEVIIPLAATIITLLGSMWKALRKVYKLVARLEDTIPTLEGIAIDYPGRTLSEHLESIENAIDLQSQAIYRLGTIVDRRRSMDTGWRPAGWELGDKS